MTARRADAGAAVAGLFANATATGGLAGRENGATRTTEGRRPRAEATGSCERASRVRVGVELTEEQSGYLRALSRPGRTNGPRTLGTKFVATGVLVAAIELLRTIDVDMRGVAAGDDAEMAARARTALLRAGAAPGHGAGAAGSRVAPLPALSANAGSASTAVRFRLIAPHLASQPRLRPARPRRRHGRERCALSPAAAIGDAPVHITGVPPRWPGWCSPRRQRRTVSPTVSPSLQI